jgi:hypothetical protein
MKTVVILPLSSVVTECGNYSNACQLLKFRFEHRWDGQVRLVHLQTDNLCLFLCQQMDKRQTFICTMSK